MTQTHAIEDIDAIDQDALQRAMERVRRDPERSEQLDAKLKDEPWHEVATFAAYCCQCQTLHLKPWEVPPCWANEDDDPDNEWDRAGQKLLQKMLSAGVSRYEPDPMVALKSSRRKR
jgi:hypothetical protein